MSNEIIAADVIEVVEKGFIKTEHVFRTLSEVFGVLNLNAGKSNGSYTGSDESRLRFTKTNFWRSNYDLQQNGAVLGRAAPRGKLSRAFLITFEDEIYGLFPGGGKFRSWIIKNNLDQVLCEIRPRGTFKRGAIITILNPMLYNLLVFSYCLVNKRWQEQSS